MGAVGGVLGAVILCEYKLVLSFYSTTVRSGLSGFRVLPRLNQLQQFKKKKGFLDIRLDRQIKGRIKIPTICFPLLGSPGYEYKYKQTHLSKVAISKISILGGKK